MRTSALGPGALTLLTLVVMTALLFGSPVLAGNSVNISGEIPAAGEAPAAAFSAAPRSGYDPMTVQFTDESTGNLTSWYWDFGDETTSGEQHPQHIYTVPGIYTVTLTIGNSFGDYDTATRTDYVTVYSSYYSSAGSGHTSGTNTATSTTTTTVTGSGTPTATETATATTTASVTTSTATTTAAPVGTTTSGSYSTLYYLATIAIIGSVAYFMRRT